MPPCRSRSPASWLADGANLGGAAIAAVPDGDGFSTVKGGGGPVDRGDCLHKVGVATAALDTAALERLVQQAEAGALTLRTQPRRASR